MVGWPKEAMMQRNFELGFFFNLDFDTQSRQFSGGIVT